MTTQANQLAREIQKTPKEEAVIFWRAFVVAVVIISAVAAVVLTFADEIGACL